jgi:hypothetical protein
MEKIKPFMISGRFLYTFFLFFIVGLHILYAKSETTVNQGQQEASQKPVIKKYKSLTLRVLEKATGITKDIIFTEAPCTQQVFGLTITCHAGFIEDINNTLTVLWAYFEIRQEDKGEKILVYNDWYNNLKPVFENPDFDMEIMEIVS